MKILPIVGLEIHVQLKTNTKMFCSCNSSYFGEKPNTHMCPTCLALPGALPIVNEEAVKKAIQVGVVLNSQINSFSKFERKNYFYPDLFKGYQITQYELPICTNGYVDLNDENGSFKKRIGITRSHLEEDTAKSIHEGITKIDGNKAGVPLLEIVSNPDINSAQEAQQYAEYLYDTLRFIKVSDCDMEKGQLRFDVNVNLQIEKENEKFATPIVEVKNLNSFRALHRAIEFEIERQEEEFKKSNEILTAGNKTTRGWDDIKGKTTFQRSKEEANDYRYLPDPDIPPLDLSVEFIEEARSSLGETPITVRKILTEDYNLPFKDVLILTRSLELYNWFREVIKNTKLTPQLAGNWIITEILNLVNEENTEINDSKFSSVEFGYLLDLINEKKITNAQAKEIIKKVYGTSNNVKEIIEKEGLSSIQDEESIGKFVDEVISENLNVVETIKAGKESAVQFLVGQVMKKTKGSATPSTVIELLKKRIS